MPGVDEVSGMERRRERSQVAKSELVVRPGLVPSLDNVVRDDGHEL